jgi:hypothetical protein
MRAKLGLNPRVAHAALRRELRLTALGLIQSGIAEIASRILMRMDRRRGLLFLGAVAAIRDRHKDHTAFWAQALLAFPDDARLVRGKIEAALRGGSLADAEDGLAWLISTGNARHADWKFVVGLSHVDHCRGASGVIRGRVRAFLKALRGLPDYRLAAVKLNRLIFAHFPRHWQSTAVATHGCNNARLLRMLARSDAGRAARNTLERVAGCEDALAASSTATIFDTDISAAQCRRFVTAVRERLACQKPFSFVRIGDGEAACLSYEPGLNALASLDAADRERIWWGKPLASAVRTKMAAKVARAMWDADCIGIPTLPRFLRELELTGNDALEDKLTGRGLRAILYNMERYGEIRSPYLPPPIFTSCHLHQELERWNLYEELLGDAGNVVLVSCHPGLADWMAGKFHIGIGGNILLPPDRVSGPMLGARVPAARDLPDILGETIDKVASVSANALVLVGAGYPGKLLVDAARAHGGVALDLGSIFDYWLGINTRSYLDLRPA